MHARTQPKWIGIEHGVKRVKPVWNSTSRDGPRIGRRGMCDRRRALYAHRGVRIVRGDAEIGNETVRLKPVSLDVVDHVVLRIVLLICTHGLSLGRTKLHYENAKRGGGTACRVDHSASEKKADSSVSAW